MKINFQMKTFKLKVSQQLVTNLINDQKGFNNKNSKNHEPFQMGKIVKTVILILATLTMIDAGFLMKYIVMHHDIISKTSFCRLITFVLSHLYFAFMLGVLYQRENNAVDEIHKYSEWLVNTLVPVATIDTFIQIALFILLGSHKNMRTVPIDSQLKDQQLHLINFYFLVYLYSTLIGILAALYVAINKLLQKYERSKYEDLIQDILDNYLIELEHNDPQLKDKDCSICQLDFITKSPPRTTRPTYINVQSSHLNTNSLHNRNANEKVSVVSLECDHMFHKECILEWVKKTYEEGMPPRCPNCRRVINE